MRLIDADKLRYEIDKHYPFTKLPQAEHGIADRAKSELLLIIHEAPVVDAVEVVRCKDCKYRPISYGDEHDLCFPVEYKCPCQCDDNWYSWMPKDDFFCARGERRDDHDAHNPKGIHA